MKSQHYRLHLGLALIPSCEELSINRMYIPSQSLPYQSWFFSIESFDCLLHVMLKPTWLIIKILRFVLFHAELAHLPSHFFYTMSQRFSSSRRVRFPSFLLKFISLFVLRGSISFISNDNIAVVIIDIAFSDDRRRSLVNPHKLILLCRCIAVHLSRSSWI